MKTKELSFYFIFIVVRGYQNGHHRCKIQTSSTIHTSILPLPPLPHPTKMKHGKNVRTKCFYVHKNTLPSNKLLLHVKMKYGGRKDGKED